MVALAGMGGGLHLAQQGVHLVGFQSAPGSHRAVAGHSGTHVLEAFLEAQRIPHCGDLTYQVAHQPGNIHLAQQGRGLAHHNRAGTERLQHQPEGGQFLRPRYQGGGGVLIEFYHLGDEQPLARH